MVRVLVSSASIKVVGVAVGWDPGSLRTSVQLFVLEDRKSSACHFKNLKATLYSQKQF